MGISAHKPSVTFLGEAIGGVSFSFRPTPSPMPALGGTSAENLRFLDFLIYEPVRTVLLHREGVSVNVPAPERYAVHKLIVASRRLTDALGRAKRDKDLLQRPRCSVRRCGRRAKAIFWPMPTKRRGREGRHGKRRSYLDSR
jgi:hypothetical protein